MYFIKKTKIRPVNKTILIQRVKDTEVKSDIVIPDNLKGVLAPRSKNFKFIAIAVSKDVADIEVGDIVEPFSVWAKNGHEENFVKRYPVYSQLFDDGINYYFDAVPSKDLRMLNKGEQGKTWDYEKPKSKLKLL